MLGGFQGELCIALCLIATTDVPRSTSETEPVIGHEMLTRGGLIEWDGFFIPASRFRVLAEQFSGTGLIAGGIRLLHDIAFRGSPGFAGHAGGLRGMALGEEELRSKVQQPRAARTGLVAIQQREGFTVGGADWPPRVVEACHRPLGRL